jgi:signal transduction histidine kinase
MASMIYPHTLFQFGLRAALSNLIENFVRMSHLSVEQKIGEIDAVCSDEVALPVYRIVQEALTNVTKHARATHVLVDIRCERDRLSGTVSNNGNSPGSETIKLSRGIGLMVINERIKRLGGELTLGAGEEWPCQLRFSFPVTAGREAARLNRE